MTECYVKQYLKHISVSLGSSVYMSTVCCALAVEGTAMNQNVAQTHIKGPD